MTEIITVAGTLKLTPGTETRLPLGIGIGAQNVRMVGVVRVIRVFKDAIGMTRSELEVTSG